MEVGVSLKFLCLHQTMENSIITNLFPNQILSVKEKVGEIKTMFSNLECFKR